MVFVEKKEKIFSFITLPTKETNKESLSIDQKDFNIKNFGIKIEKIGIVAPIIANVDGATKDIYNKKLKNGVAHLKGSSFPGQGGNIFIFGHSSSNIGEGLYSKIFARLGKLEKGDKIIIFYKNKEYIYSVFEKKIVEKTDISVIESTKEEQLTLMTCWPVGTAEKRLIIKSFLVK